MSRNIPGTGLFMSVGSKVEIDKEFKIKSKKPQIPSMRDQSLNLELYDKVEN